MIEVKKKIKLLLNPHCRSLHKIRSPVSCKPIIRINTAQSITRLTSVWEEQKTRIMIISQLKTTLGFRQPQCNGQMVKGSRINRSINIGSGNCSKHLTANQIYQGYDRVSHDLSGARLLASGARSEEISSYLRKFVCAWINAEDLKICD